MSEVQVLNIHKPSFARRWIEDFLFERHSIAARMLLLAIAIFFFVYGPLPVLWLVEFLPVSQLGSSGASVFAHHVLQGTAALLAALIGYLAFRPCPYRIIANSRGIRMVWQSLFFPLEGPTLGWDEIETVGIERPKASADSRTSLLCLQSKQNSKASIKIPLANLESDETREELSTLIKTHCKLTAIEPGALDAIKPSRNLSFTDIWLDALSAPPGRERLTPLLENSKLKNRFEIKKRLGGGGQATAYLAFDCEKSELLVLKETILPVYADLHARKQALEAFHAEALALESVKHPQIVKYIDSFVEDHRAYLVLEFIEGKTLRKLIKEQGPVPEREAIQMALQMCELLETLHGLEPPLIHRDFTPDNLMVNSSGKLVLIDFAVAINSDEENGESAGKLAYMAPEQFNGSTNELTDLYSLAGTIHYVLTAEDPIALKASNPSSINSDISQELNDLIAQASAQDYKDRFTSVSKLKDQLLRAFKSSSSAG
ncbi:MAG: serine/threonine protein kinase [Candidatus Obscuribacterales bacterium]|nr:serine/threonine protein kinase [Candidatus Obscuribacterales bacterium]